MTMVEARDILISFERLQSGGRDAANEPIAAAPATLGTSWAAMRDLSEREAQDAGQEASKRVARFTVRSNPITRALTGKDMIRVGVSDLWDIKANIAAPGGRMRYRIITAVRRTDAAGS